MPLLFGLALAHVALSRTYRFISARLSPTSSPQSPNYAPVRARGARAWFSAVFSLVLLAALHGTSLPKIVLILYVNYRIARLGAADGGDGLSGARTRDPGQATSIRWRREWTPYATWVFNVGILFANVLGEGYYYSSLGSSFAFLVRQTSLFAVGRSKQSRSLTLGGRLQDNYKGLLPRWQISWNITMLRLVSFNMEWYWASSAALGAPSKAAGDAGSVLPEPPTSPQVKVRSTPDSLFPSISYSRLIP